ncbi:putative reverse transcriptase domain-containing protein [Tanacetum coccineum]
MTPEANEELIAQRVAKALAVYEANHAAGLVVEIQSQNGDDGDNENGRGNGDGNGGGNGNEDGRGNGNGNPNRNNKGTKGVVGLTRWFEKMEKNSHKRTIRAKAAFAMSWRELMKRMNEGNVIAAEPMRLQDAIRIANNLVDLKLKGYAARSVENKIRLDSNQKDNRVQQPPYKRQNVSGHNVARAYMASNNERKGYVRSWPYCNKCKLHHEGQCTGNYRSNCPKLKNQNRGNKTGNKTNEARGKAYIVWEEERGCTLGLLGHPFNIDLMLVELGSFNVIIGMDWLVNHLAVIIFDEKIIRIPYGDEVLIVQVTEKETEDKSEEKRLEDVPTIRDFPKNKKEHEEHIKLILRLLKKEELYTKFSKFEFWLSNVQFLGHVIDSEGIHVDPAKIESIKD